MKVCPSCRHRFATEDWCCPRCGSRPPIIDGLTAFAPALAAESEDFPAASHEVLDRLQAGSFWFRARNRLIVDLIRRYAPDARHVMEIGCGTGFVLAAIQRTLPDARLVGSEIYAHGLRYARQRLGGDVTLLQMDARSIPYDQEFDLIGAFDVLEHIDEDQVVIGEMLRAVRPGGHLFVAVPQHPMLWSAPDDYGHHKRRYERSELRRKLRAAGAHVRLDTSFVATLFPVLLAQRLGRGRHTAYNANAELTLPHWLDRTFEAALDAERALIARGMRFPFGGSRVVVAERPHSAGNGPQPQASTLHALDQG